MDMRFPVYHLTGVLDAISEESRVMWQELVDKKREEWLRLVTERKQERNNDFR